MRTATRSIPLTNWVDDNSRHQIINQVIFEEFITAKDQNRTNWVVEAQKHLQKYGITLGRGRLTVILRELKTGKRDASAASAFRGIYNGLGSRYGKNGMYERMDLLESMFLKSRNYVGLPANQLSQMGRKYDTTVACELDKKMFDFMVAMKEHFCYGNDVQVVRENIFDVLESAKKKFSVYDFDLMGSLEVADIIRIADCVSSTSENRSVINVASSVARSQSYAVYDRRMPSVLINRLGDSGFKVKYFYSGAYKDSVFPMKYELLAVQR